VSRFIFSFIYYSGVLIILVLVMNKTFCFALGARIEHSLDELFYAVYEGWNADFVKEKVREIEKDILRAISNGCIVDVDEFDVIGDVYKLLDHLDTAVKCYRGGNSYCARANVVSS